MQNIYNINKPKGWTSNDVVQKIKHHFHYKKVGHAGTLDPNAVGVLVIGFNEGTKLLSKLQTDDKEYIAEIQIGVETNTYDICGKCIARKPTSNITLHQIIEELTKLKQGDYWQVPPVYSAKRIQGKQLYKLAYSQQQIPVIKPQLVRLFDFQIIEFLDDILQVRLHVSKGFYIRSLAHDLGVQLDTGANLVNLKRTRSGEFTIENSISLEQLFSDN